MTERWRPIPDWPYEASDQGRVRRRGRVLKPYLDGSGYPQVSLYREGHRKNKHVHRLVVEAFHGSTNLHVDHLDGDKQNNSLANLSLVTISENVLRAQALGLRKPPPVLRGQDNPAATLSDWQVAEIRRRAKAGVSIARLALDNHVHRSTVSRILSRNRR